MSESSIFVIGGNSSSPSGVENALRSLAGAMRLRQPQHAHEELAHEPDLEAVDGSRAHRLRVRADDAT